MWCALADFLRHRKPLERIGESSRLPAPNRIRGLSFRQQSWWGSAGALAIGRGVAVEECSGRDTTAAEDPYALLGL